MANNDIDAVIEATDIVSLINEYVDLKKEGKNYKGCCPFHNEKTPSFVVSPEKKLFNCFGCHKGGNAIRFVQLIENVDFKTALEKLADKANIKLNREIVNKPKNNYEKYYNIFKTAIDFYAINLNATEYGLKAKEYLYKRGITDEAIDIFNIGLSPNSYDSLYQVLKDKEFLELDMQDLSLVAKGNNKYHDFFVKRIMFPIYDELNNPIAFSGRIFDTVDKNQPKYINSSESIIFKKNSTLFNLNNAKKYINKLGRVILFEGQMDVIKAYMSGLFESVASLSTSFTTNHASVLKKYTNNVIICYDSDSAGINSSKKVINILLNMDFNVKLVLLPLGLDPDEYYQKYGQTSLKDYIDNNIIDPIEYTYRAAFIDKNLEDNLDVEAIKNEIFNILKRYNSNTISEKYLNKLSNDLKVNINSLNNDFNNFITPQIDYVEPIIDDNIIIKTKPKKDYYNIAELRLIMYAKASKANATYIEKELGEYIIYLSNKISNLWNKLIYEFYYNFDSFDEGVFIKLLTDEEMEFYTMLLDKMRQDRAFFNQDDMIDCITKVKEVALKSKMEDLINKSNNEIDQKLKLKYSSEIFEIKKEIENIRKRRGRNGF